LADLERSEPRIYRYFYKDFRPLVLSLAFVAVLLGAGSIDLALTRDTGNQFFAALGGLSVLGLLGLICLFCFKVRNETITIANGEVLWTDWSGRQRFRHSLAELKNARLVESRQDASLKSYKLVLGLEFIIWLNTIDRSEELTKLLTADLNHLPSRHPPVPWAKSRLVWLLVVTFILAIITEVASDLAQLRHLHK
jgi:hypothetical protein